MNCNCGLVWRNQEKVAINESVRVIYAIDFRKFQSFMWHKYRKIKVKSFQTHFNIERLVEIEFFDLRGDIALTIVIFLVYYYIKAKWSTYLEI